MREKFHWETNGQRWPKKGWQKTRSQAKLRKYQKMKLIEVVMNNEYFEGLVFQLNLNEISLNKFFLIISPIEKKSWS